ncbi:PREDICTED: uracil-DNA glycosylase, mitochondrial-like [Ipomoea nil]|uniref:uracil-DNA glycosylase, mitochondrial-like n=1 Tax=Ipomoea nil TaxID=35883 RepID=UPI000900C4BD|nr:PREDICTED: uracil-DNA glycosylase, mitochondrial-like [Ipomoea nil]
MESCVKEMASSSGKTILDFFKQPAAKRLKRISSPPSSPPSTVLVANSFSSTASSSPTDGDADQNDVVLPTTTVLTPDQKSRIEFNKSLAKAKRNLKLCAEMSLVLLLKVRGLSM